MREERNYTRWEAPEALKEVDCKEFGGERALFATGGLELRRCVFHEGESALKCCRDIVADGCRFEGKYPFWHVDGFRITDCVFTPGARAALWYSRNLVMKDTRVDAPKMFREMENLYLENVTVPDAQETLWSCRGVTLRDVEVKGADYLFAHSADIDIDGYRQEGNYSFQYCRDVVIRNAVIHSKDAFWETDNVTVYDSEIDGNSTVKGEYLAWYSENVTFISCKIIGTQPLCYCENLVMEDCVMGPECDLAFEDSSLRATVVSQIVSVKNPRTGSLKALSIGEIITDRNILAPADCRIETEI